MPTLYRKYRPQTFAEVSGQEPIKITLGYEISSEKIAHAYLFCGPRAIGKTTMARLLAKAINCQKRKKGSSDPCNECPSCLEITQGNSLDVVEIDAASHTGVDNVREAIIASARVAPTRSTYKVFIIDEAHMLSVAAFNALLKTMEEPPAHVVFILCTTEAHKLPTTIISRCQRFDFKKIGYNEIVKKLGRIATSEDIKIEPAVLEAVARHANGHMRDAESLLGQVIALGSGENSHKGKKITVAEAELIIPRNLLKEAVDLLEMLIPKDAAGAVAYVNKLAEDGADLKILSSEVVEVARQVILQKINPALASSTGLEFGESLETHLMDLSSRFEVTDLSFLIERFGLAGKEIKDAPIAQLPLELAIIDFCFCMATTEREGTPAYSPTPGMTQAVKTVVPSAVKTSKTKKESNGNDQAPIFTEAALQTLWQELLIRIRQHNHSLAFVLKSCMPMGVEQGKVKLAFKYKIHHDRMNDPAIRELVEGLLQEISGQKVLILTILDPELVLVDNSKLETGESESSRVATAATEAAGIDSSTIDNLLKTFGGKIVS